MRLIQVRDRAKEAIDRLTARLNKQFPDEQGRHAVVFGSAPQVDMGSKHYGWPPEDDTPDFVKEANEGWVKITDNRR